MEHVEEALSLSPTEIDALGDDIAVMAAHIDAATHRLLALIREFDRAGGWYRQGALSCAHWLSWRIGLGLGPAREKVRVAHKLAELPLLDEAFRRGELSYSKLRAMTRVASSDNEAALLDLARNSTAAQLERICRLYRQAHPTERPSPRDQDDRRWVVTRPTDDGMVAIQIRLLPEEAARLMRAIEHCADRGSLADGAVALADSGLAGGAGADGPIRPPVEVVVHVAAATLDGHTDLGDGLSSETCRRLLCDAGVVPMVEDGAGKTIDVGRKTRTIPAALRRALDARDQTCRFPGCSHRRFLRRPPRRALDRRGRDEPDQCPPGLSITSSPASRVRLFRRDARRRAGVLRSGWPRDRQRAGATAGPRGRGGVAARQQPREGDRDLRGDGRPGVGRLAGRLRCVCRGDRGLRLIGAIGGRIGWLGGGREARRRGAPPWTSGARRSR
jgi:hypothetical protein